MDSTVAELVVDFDGHRQRVVVGADIDDLCGKPVTLVDDAGVGVEAYQPAPDAIIEMLAEIDRLGQGATCLERFLECQTDGWTTCQRRSPVRGSTRSMVSVSTRTSPKPGCATAIDVVSQAPSTTAANVTKRRVRGAEERIYGTW
jgi:hypothetical protein